MNDYNIFFNNYLDFTLQMISFAANFETVTNRKV